MPRGKKATGRTASASSTSKASSKQSALNFSGRVTKPSASTRSASAKKLDDKTAALEREISAAPTSTDLSLSPSSTPEPTTSGISGLSGGKLSDLPSSELAIRQQAAHESSTPQTPEELEASKIPETQIKKYWAGKEAERTTKRVHQEGLSLHEKVLREFDMSSQYGPCMGVARTKRWRLAHELGLRPPMEVLAVLVRESERVQGEEARTKVQRAFVDELMSSRFVVD